MAQISNLTSKDKAWLPAVLGSLPARTAARQLAAILAGLLVRIGDRLFAPNDREASWRGWQAERRLAGLGRRYRDPRFAALARCRRCHGAGSAETGLRCARCTGTGRVVLGSPPRLPGGG